MSPLRKLRINSGEIVILIVIGILLLFIITGNFQQIMHALYSPTVVLIVVVMSIEYLLLKGSDRSAMLKREIEAARQKRRDDLLAMRDLEARLVEQRTRLEAALSAAPADDLDAPALREELEKVKQTGQEMIALLRERV